MTLTIMGLTVGATQDGRSQIDGSACLIHHHSVIAVAEERICRKKHRGGCYGAMESLLSSQGLSLNDVDLFVVSTCGESVPRNSAPVYIRDERLWSLQDRGVGDEKILWSPSHHLSHGLHGFYSSDFSQALVLVLDYAGNRECNSYYHFQGDRRDVLRQDSLPEDSAGGFGAAYSFVSDIIGFPGMTQAGKTMALAGFGKAMDPPLEFLERIQPSGGWICRFPPASPGQTAQLENWLRHGGCSEFVEAVMDGDLQARADMAFAVQNELEEKLLEELRYWAARTGCSNIVLSGGTALNCRLAGRIMTEEAQWQLHVPFAPGDTGQSLGNAIYGLIHLGEPIPPALKSPFLGPAHPQEERGFQKLSRGFRVRKTDIPKTAARLLLKGAVLGLHYGPSEFGPRALGHRSILAAPNDRNIINRLNRRIKHREAFRPYGVIALQEEAGRYFENLRKSPFMMMTFQVNREYRKHLAGVTHVDGSSRVQTLSDTAENHLCYRILREYFQLSGIPCLLNTSFNDSGQPIVETLAESFAAFQNLSLDALVTEYGICDMPIAEHR